MSVESKDEHLWTRVRLPTPPPFFKKERIIGWDHDKSDNPKGITCKHCVTHPELVQTGHGEPRSLKCPVCKGRFSSAGEKYDATKCEKQTVLVTKEEMQEIWESIWGQTKAP